MMLTARDLTRRLRGRPLVAGVTLDIRPAEMLGLIGPNGSGKSTLLRMLAGLVRPDGGQVTLDGKPLRDMPARQVARSAYDGRGHRVLHGREVGAEKP